VTEGTTERAALFSRLSPQAGFTTLEDAGSSVPISPAAASLDARRPDDDG
jgi:hypothetical protein